MNICTEYSRYFAIHRRNSTPHAERYVKGLRDVKGRKNISHLSKGIGSHDYEDMQHFVSDSPWDHVPLMRQLARDVEKRLVVRGACVLYINESAFPKKGKSPAGVERQICGWQSKENCQIGVFASLGQGRFTVPVDFRLFLPESWANNAQRCAKVKVPEQERVFRTKSELALEMVGAAISNKLGHEWIVGGEIFGSDHKFTDELEKLGQAYLMDVDSETQVWEQNPDASADHATAANHGKSGKGGKKQKQKRSSVAGLAKKYESDSRMMIVSGAGTKGAKRVRLWARRVWVWNGRAKDPVRERWLVVRNDAGKCKYSLSNARVGTSWEKLREIQEQHHLVQHAFENSKNKFGMTHYGGKSWRGWHHHMALYCLALLEALREHT